MHGAWVDVHLWGGMYMGWYWGGAHFYLHVWLVVWGYVHTVGAAPPRTCPCG